MSDFIIKISPTFERNFHRLNKKYPSIASDIKNLFNDLKQNPTSGQALGRDCYKIRVAISSKRKGKSGGGRIITCVKIIQNTVHVMTIYDKSEKADITVKELENLLKELGLD
jgi:mRNA-degrading endonuclease RelE of RelBE toxin-antitoxin system